ncbi:hypothetical protein CWG93_18915 [Salmonella enterica subsp. enterica serovar Sandiego]|nr:hypothetical protein [Salmonella enterica subsp. enterica serovar Sandiego]
MKKLFAMLLLLNVGNACALGIDNVILINGKNKEGDFFNLVNDSDVPVYVKTELGEVTYRDGAPVEHPYTRNNLNVWKATTNPSLFILDPNERKKVAVTMIAPERNLKKDEVFYISFVPQAQITDNKKVSKMSLQVGFKAYYFVPATISDIKYTTSYNPKTGELKINNHGNTFVVAEINDCKENASKKLKGNCEAMFLAPAGRSKTFTVPTFLRKDKITVEFVNHNRTYRKKVII